MPKLEHDRQLIERLASVYEASAMVHLNAAVHHQESHNPPQSRWSQHEMIAASSLALAASYSSLIDPKRAIALYGKASESYRSLGHSYAITLALASANRKEISRMLSFIDAGHELSAQAIGFAMVANELSNDERRGLRTETLTRYWLHVGNVPIGRLGIPLDHYVQCARAIRSAQEDRNVEILFAEGASYVYRAAEVIRSASHDRFHWLQMRSPVLPAEPEAIAMTTAMSMVSHSVFEMSLNEMSNLDANGRLLVEIGDEMWNAGNSPTPRSNAR